MLLAVASAAISAPALLSAPGAEATTTPSAPSASVPSSTTTTSSTVTSTTTTTPPSTSSTPTTSAPTSLANVSGPNSLSSGGILNAGSHLSSPSGAYQLSLQTNGNLVESGPGDKLIWNTRTTGSRATKLIMQEDGNLVLYTASGHAVWWTRTEPSANDSLVLWNSGALVLRSQGNIPLWENGSTTGNLPYQLAIGQSMFSGQQLIAANGLYKAVVQSDGNFVLYGPHGPTWQSFTSGQGFVQLVMQDDGNLVMYNSHGAPIWFSNSSGTPANRLVVQNDGNLVIYGTTGAVWAKGVLLWHMPTSVGVYAYPTGADAIADGWPIIGVTGALGACGSPFTGVGFTPGDSNDEQVGQAIAQSGKVTPWLSFWTVSGPSHVANGNCVVNNSPFESPASFYHAGFTAGTWVAKNIDSYANQGLHLKPSYVVLDPEGFPDDHSGLDNGLGGTTGPTAFEDARWVQMLAGWKAGLASVDATLTAAFYVDQAEYLGFHLAAINEPAFIAVAFGANPTNPNLEPVNPTIFPGVNGANIHGFIAFFAGPSQQTQCTYVRQEADFLASLNTPLNTLQFSTGRCPA